MVVVVDGKAFEPTEGLKDGNWLREPLDLAARVQSVLQLKDSESIVSTRAVIEIVVGMLMSDGITAFDNRGRLLGFNVFAKPVTSEEAEIANSGMGGARHRAFALLSSWVGGSVVACFMVSQDGATEYQEILRIDNHEQH